MKGGNQVTKWKTMTRDYTEDDKKKIIAKVIEVAIQEIFANHVYRFDGKLYRQKEGGAIGLRLTGIVARIVMDRWGTDWSGRWSSPEY